MGTFGQESTLQVLGVKVLGPREGRVGSEPRPVALHQAGLVSALTPGFEKVQGGCKGTAGGSCVQAINNGEQVEQSTQTHFFLLLLLQMAATIDMNFQSDLLSIFEENLF